MKAEEYFGDWIDVIDKEELRRVVTWVNKINSANLCPSPKNIFKAFRACSFKDCKVVFLGQDPYPQRGVATGILFGNSEDTSEEYLSPSLKVVKEAAINYEIPHNLIEFDNTLESWAKQGILMINTALTCEVGKVGAHFDIWKPFMSKEDDFIEVTEWANGEGWDVTINDRVIPLTRGELDAIDYLTKGLDYDTK